MVFARTDRRGMRTRCPRGRRTPVAACVASVQRLTLAGCSVTPCGRRRTSPTRGDATLWRRRVPAGIVGADYERAFVRTQVLPRGGNLRAHRQRRAGAGRYHAGGRGVFRRAAACSRIAAHYRRALPQAQRAPGRYRRGLRLRRPGKLHRVADRDYVRQDTCPRRTDASGPRAHPGRDRAKRPFDG